MRSITRTILLTAAFMFAAVAARADHMTGTYSGTGEAQGVTLQLQQSGRTVTGNLSGAAQGSLNGQSDGGDNATGTVQLQGAGQFNFDGRWSQQGFNLTLIGSDGKADFFFASGAGAPPQQQPPQQQPPQQQPPAAQPPPPPGNASVEYFLVDNGVAAGPFTLAQVKQRLAEGRTRREDLIWKEGLADWVRIDTLPEFAEGGATPPPPPPPANGGPKPPEGGAKPPVLLSPGFPGRNK